MSVVNLILFEPNPCGLIHRRLAGLGMLLLCASDVFVARSEYCQSYSSGPNAHRRDALIDGFRADYMDLFPDQSQNLRHLAGAGLKTSGLLPGFPSSTFPNHYSIVTGLYPATTASSETAFTTACATPGIVWAIARGRRRRYLVWR